MLMLRFMQSLRHDLFMALHVGNGSKPIIACNMAEVPGCNEYFDILCLSNRFDPLRSSLTTFSIFEVASNH